MNIKTFKKEVEAVFFDGINNVQEIANWCGGEVIQLVDHQGEMRSDMYAIDIPSPGGYVTAGKDFYIFKDGPSFFALQKEIFNTNFGEKVG